MRATSRLSDPAWGDQVTGEAAAAATGGALLPITRLQVGLQSWQYQQSKALFMRFLGV